MYERLSYLFKYLKNTLPQTSLHNCATTNHGFQFTETVIAGKAKFRVLFLKPFT